MTETLPAAESTARDAKRRVRRAMRSRRRALPPEARRAAAERAAGHVRSLPEWRAARRVALYAALPDELPTEPLLREVLAAGRPLLLPRVAGDRLVFAALRDLAALRPGPLGAGEPPPDAPSERLAAGDLVLVPGVAFDRTGVRLGRGGGWYDRALADAPPGLHVIGLGYAFQLVDRLPREPHDRPVEAVVTDAGVWRVAPRDPGADPG